MSLSWFTLGAAGWMASEYAIHRFVGHGPLRAAPVGRERLTPKGIAAAFNVEHVAHHTDTSYFAPTSQKILAASVAIPVVGAALTPFIGVRRAVSFACGLTAMYGTYEFLHRRVHTHPPKNAYGRWLRKHHLLHHYRTPKMNHGVTTPLFDRLAGTHIPAEKVRVPRQSPPPWLIDPATGDVRAEYQADYELGPMPRPNVTRPAPAQA